MNINAVARQYDKLEPEERFRLVIEALARDDRQEADRLPIGRRHRCKECKQHDPRHEPSS